MSIQRKIVILGVGGTIAGQGAAHGGGVNYQAGQIAVADLLKPLLDSSFNEYFSFEVEQIAQLDSKDMDIVTWQSLAKACVRWLAQEDVTSLVITHGTDTLEETAWFLQSVLQPSKPVVLTCAMRPATALSADGPANLRDAVLCAAQGRAGVWVVTAGEIHSSKMVRKVHTYRLNAFDSGAQGPSGWVEEGYVRWVNSVATSITEKEVISSAVWAKNADLWPWVEIVTSTAAATSAGVEALVCAGVRGLVVAATGNGSVHCLLQAGLLKARTRGVLVWRTTRCEQGQVVLAQGEDDAEAIGLSPVKARISMILELLRHA
ncbi:MAG: asparaginase [Comamonas sp.]|nr:asparaginase [Comamonas sp.]